MEKNKNQFNELVAKKIEWFKSTNKKVKKQLNAQITSEDKNSFVVDIPVLISLDEQGMLTKLEYDVLESYEIIQNENLCKFCKKTVDSETEIVSYFGDEKFHTECYIKDMLEKKNEQQDNKEAVVVNKNNNNNSKKIG